MTEDLGAQSADPADVRGEFIVQALYENVGAEHAERAEKFLRELLHERLLARTALEAVSGLADVGLGKATS